MNHSESSYNMHVIKSILANNQWGITEVNNIESLKSIFFIKEQYESIEELIKSNDIQAIRLLPESIQTEEYLEIMTFTDQYMTKYFTTVYDNIILEQDPQVIKIYRAT